MKSQLTRSLLTLLLIAALGIVGGMCVVPPATAFPVSAALSPRAANGLFPKIHYPKINFGKGAKAVLSPVTKTAVKSGKTVIGGGKAVVNGGVVAAKSAQKGVEIYEAGRALSSKTNGVPNLPHLK